MAVIRLHHQLEASTDHLEGSASLRGRGDDVRRGELDRLATRLGGLDDRQREAVEALAAGIVGKLLHEPTVRMKDSAGTARGERLAEALRDLFDL